MGGMPAANRASGMGGITAAVWMLLVLACFGQVWIVQKELPDLVEWYDSRGFDYTAQQLEGLAESSGTGFYLQAVLPVEGPLSAGRKEMKVCMADAEYFAWSGMRLETGQWPAKRGWAAVGSEWALLCYKHLDIIGQPVQVDGRTCRISGVYQQRGSFRQQLAGDGRQAVFLPFCTEDLSAVYVMNYLYFPKDGGDIQSSQAYLEDTAARAAGVRAAPELVLDMESVSHVCIQNAAVCVILWLFAAALLLKMRGYRAGSFLCLTSGIVFLVCHRWYLPMEYLPQKQIFDFAGYVGRYIQRQNLRHLYQECGYFGNLAYIHTWMSFGILAASGVFASVFFAGAALKLLRQALERV